MAKSQVQARVPRNTEEKIKRYQQEEGIEAESEAARQLIEAGVEAQRDSGAGERLAETGTAISSVGALTAALAAITGSGVGLALVTPFLGAVFVFAVLLASIRVMANKDLA
jgi:hypothetical protein